MRLPHAGTLKKIWLAAVLSYAAFRAFAVDYLLGRYGVRGEVYFAIEIITSIPFARFSAELVEDIVTKTPWRRDALVTGASYIAPDVYLLATIHSAPSRIYLFTLAVVVLLTIISALLLRMRVQRVR